VPGHFKILAGKFPLESCRRIFVEFLEVKNAGLEFFEIHEVIRGQDFTFNDGKVNLDLIDQLAWMGV